MATVTGLTAARMLDIEASSIVEGEVNLDGDLILTTHGGVTINAGNVEGPKGDDAAVEIPYKSSTELPETYPVGISFMSFGGSGTDWPVTLGTVFTFLINSTRGFQIVNEKDSDLMYFRTVGQNVWSPFELIATKNNVDIWIANALTPFALKSYVDDLHDVPELGSGVDLNTIVQPGVYTQSFSANAGNGVNYPIGYAGLLEVFANGSNMVWQQYTPYGSFGKEYYTRRSYNGTWYAWDRFVSTPKDSDAQVTYGSGWTYTSSTAVIPWVRQRRGTVYLQGAGRRSSGTSEMAFTIPVGFRPEFAVTYPIFAVNGGNAVARDFRLTVDPTGEVTVTSPTSGTQPPWDSATWFSFNSVWPIPL